jgi:membrane associated rhomboid family serine protease
MANILRRPIKYSHYNATIILIVANILVFLFGFVDNQRILVYAYLIPAYVLQAGWWWQVVTYMFVHAGWAHIFFNMLALFLFGIQLEQRMGSTEFLLYYFVCGIGAGIVTVFFNNATGQGMIPVVGASGAIYGLLLAFGVCYPEQTVLMNFLFTIKAKYMVAIYAAIALYSSLGVNSGVSNIAHLGGMVVGFVYLKSGMRSRQVRLPDWRGA